MTYFYCIFFVDDRVSVTCTDDKIIGAVICTKQYSYNTWIENFRRWNKTTKMMVMRGKRNTRTKILISNHITEKVNSFNYFGYTITVTSTRDFEIKRNRLNQMCCIISRALDEMSRNYIQIKFYEAMVVPVLKYRSEIWT